MGPPTILLAGSFSQDGHLREQQLPEQNPTPHDFLADVDDPEINGTPPYQYDYNDYNYIQAMGGLDLLLLQDTGPSWTPYTPSGDILAGTPSQTAIPHYSYDNASLQDQTWSLSSYAQEASFVLPPDHSIPAQKQGTSTYNERNEIALDLEPNDNSSSLEESSSPTPLLTRPLRHYVSDASSFLDVAHSANSPQVSPVPSHSVEATRMKTAPRSQRKHLQLKCDFCLKLFTRRCDLNKHVKTHELAFKCTIAGCDHTQGFALQKDLRRHIDAIHWKSTFTCHYPNCGMKFSRRDNCQRHFEVQHPIATKS